MKKGAIVLTPFPFTNLSGQKNRPALVLSLSRQGEDVLVAFISSVVEKKGETDLLISKDHPDFAGTGLKLDFTEVCKFHAAKRLARASVESACVSRSF